MEDEHAHGVQQLEQRRERLQRQLKPLCASVRNAYSTARLQSDFRAGTPTQWLDLGTRGVS
jgi:hypothetical protein